MIVSGNSKLNIPTLTISGIRFARYSVVNCPTSLALHTLNSSELSWARSSFRRVSSCTKILRCIPSKISCIYTPSEVDVASNHNGMVIVIMGVGGVGKSTIGEMLAIALNATFIDADDFHSQSNKEKMSKGIPLSDKDRIPWLEILQSTLRESIIRKKFVILGCSALQKKYREILRSADPHYESGSYASLVKFVLLDAPAEVISSRLKKRAAEGKHFMPATLLQSQLGSLEIDDSEGIFKVDATQSPQSIISTILAYHFHWQTENIS